MQAASISVDIPMLTSDFWQVSGLFYQIPAVQQVLLARQADAGWQINRLLLACWFSTRFHCAIKPPGDEGAIAKIGQLESSISRFRIIRRELRRRAKQTPVDNQRKQLGDIALKLELGAEKLHQSLLVRSFVSKDLLCQYQPSFSSDSVVLKQNILDNCQKLGIKSNVSLETVIEMWTEFGNRFLRQPFPKSDSKVRSSAVIN